MMLQAANLNIPNAVEEVKKTLKMVRMEGAASNKYKNCSLGMPAGMLHLKENSGQVPGISGYPACCFCVWKFGSIHYCIRCGKVLKGVFFYLNADICDPGIAGSKELTFSCR